MTEVSRAVVTGGAGFIGSHIVDELIRRKIETFVIDDLSTGSLENLKQNATSGLLHVIVDDARRIGKLLSGVTGIDVVFHEAAIASVPRSVKEPMVVHDANVNVSLDVMNFCISKKVRRFVFASSAAVYGILGTVAASEDVPCRPSSPYGASKMAVEDYLQAYHNTYGLETMILRYFNVYGPRQAYSDYSGVITIFINQLLSRDPLTIYGDGRQVRDFVNVRDIVQANMAAMETEHALGEAFNVASGDSTSILELIEGLKAVTGVRSLEHRFLPPRSGDVRFGKASIEKIKDLLGYRKTVSMERGLAELVDSVRRKAEVELLQV